MRDKRFVAAHRGGPLAKEQHRQLIHWACKCVKHVLPLPDDQVNSRIIQALLTAKEWEQGNATVGDARKAAYDMLALARVLTSPVEVAIVRAAGHAAATAHMADHAPGAALYVLKALKIAGKDVEHEKRWQAKQLPAEIKTLVLSVMEIKGSYFKI